MKKGILFLLVITLLLITAIPAMAAALPPQQISPECTAPYYQPDGRINAWHQCAPIAGYADGVGGLTVYRTVANDYRPGEMVLSVSAAEIAAAKAVSLGDTEQVLIKQVSDVAVYYTGGGYLKIEIAGVYGFEFDGGLLGTPPADWGPEVYPLAYNNHGMHKKPLKASLTIE